VLEFDCGLYVFDVHRRIVARYGQAMLDVSPWGGLVLIEEMTEGNRNQVWRAEFEDAQVAVRRSRRSAASLEWELDLIGFLDAHSFIVPTVVLANNGRRHVDDVVVQRWIPGREPDSLHDWKQIARELQRLHALSIDYPQRPGCCSVGELVVYRRSGDADLDNMELQAVSLVLSVFEAFAACDTAVVHGDVGAPNLRITPEGRVGLLDWDESRVDVTAHDLSPLGVQVLSDADHAAAQRLSNAWEAANSWVIEPEYARRRLTMLDD